MMMLLFYPKVNSIFDFCAYFDIIKRIKTTPLAIASHGQNTHYTHTRSLKKNREKRERRRKKEEEEEEKEKKGFQAISKPFLVISSLYKVNMLNSKL